MGFLERQNHFGPVAQRLEQGTHNPLVGGSNPSRTIVQVFSSCPKVLDYRTTQKNSTTWNLKSPSFASGSTHTCCEQGIKKL